MRVYVPALDRSLLLAVALAATSISSSACKSSRKATAADGTILTPYLAIGDTLADWAPPTSQPRAWPIAR